MSPPAGKGLCARETRVRGEEMLDRALSFKPGSSCAQVPPTKQWISMSLLTSGNRCPEGWTRLTALLTEMKSSFLKVKLLGFFGQCFYELRSHQVLWLKVKGAV